MRYRPFGTSGLTISALTLVIPDPPPGERDLTRLVHAALECGINSFELRTTRGPAVSAFGDAVRSVDRSLVIVTLRTGGPGGSGPDAVLDRVETVLTHAGLGGLDVLTLDAPEPGDIGPRAFEALKTARSRGRFRLLGISGDDAAVEGPIRSNLFDLLATRYNVLSGWPERNRVKMAVSRGMAVAGYGHWGAEMADPAAPTVEPARRWSLGLGKPKATGAALTRKHGYEFLKQTRGWTPEEICLAHALTEPSLATVQVQPDSVEHLEALASVPERDLPAGLAAQIEMARFSVAS